MSKTTFEKWEFSCVNYETDSHDNVTKIWCKICCKFYSDQDASSQKKGVAKKSANLLVKGTMLDRKKTMWKANYSCLFYQTAVLTSAYPTFESSWKNAVN